MDTGSHLLFGATLAGLAHLQPAVQSDPTLSAAVLCAAMIGSHAPDFDAVFRIGGADAYFRQHRRWSHSLPALALWPLAIGPLTAWIFGCWPDVWLLTAWSLLAVVLHVALDLTNAYGVQCLLPLRRKWLHLDALCLTEPFLLMLHGGALIGWLAAGGRRAGVICGFAWATTALYAAWRIGCHELAVRRIKKRFHGWKAVHALPDLRWFRWHYVVQMEKEFRMGQLQGRRLLPAATLPRESDEAAHECVRASRGVPHVQALLRFAKRAYFKWQAQPDGGYLVVWTDLRFWRERDWPFRAEVRLDGQLNVIEQKLGWHKKAWEPPYV
jgi:inner membrane protein